MTKIDAKCMNKKGSIATVVHGKVAQVKRPYDKGGCILCGARGEWCPMQKSEFSLRYDTSDTDPASDPTLAKAALA